MTMTVPDWVQDAIFYQVFPDRFKNRDPNNDPAGVVDWGARPTRENFFGGGLAGVIESGAGCQAFVWPDQRGLRFPADFDSVQAPFGAAAAGADRLPVDFHEDRVRVAAGKDAKGDPAGPLRDVIER